MMKRGNALENYNQLYTEIKKFYDVNDELKNALNLFCLETHNITLDDFFKSWAEKYSKSDNVKDIINALEEANKCPHSISELEDLYETIESF